MIISEWSCVGNDAVLTSVETGVTILTHDARKRGQGALLLTSTLNVHLRLDSDVRVGNRSSKQLAQGTKEEGNSRSHLATLLNRVLELLEQSVLKNGVDDEDKSWDDTSEKGLGTLVLEKQQQSADGAGSLGRLGRLACLNILLLLLLASSDSGVDNPDGVGDDNGSGASNGTGDHRLNGSELGASATSLSSGFLEERAGPFVPVVVDKVGNADAEEGRVNTGVKTRDTLASDDVTNSLAEIALGLLGLDLGACRESNKRVALILLAHCVAFGCYKHRRYLRQDHGQKTASSASQSVSDIVILGDGGNFGRLFDLNLVWCDLDLCNRGVDLRSSLLFGVV